MYDPLAMRRLQGIRHLDGQTQRLRHRHRTMQGPAVHIFHHQVVRPYVVERANVRMVQRGDGAGFTLEPGVEPRLGDFDGDHAVEARVHGLVDRAHPARADDAHDPIGA